MLLRNKMGGRRKTKTVIVNQKEKCQTNWTWNCSVTARNLRKSDLAGVIFGCKHKTIRECLKEGLFGLPAPHFSYVKNIDPGLPLFLFNYSDRKLYGVFEAASHGRLNINPNGWTTDGSDTPYAAQVRFRIRMECQPLLEDQFSPIISNNYYEPRLFWFELDRDQTKKLISMFSSVQITSSASLSKNMDKKTALSKPLHFPNGAQGGESVKTHLLNTNSYPNKANTEWGSSWDASGLGEESWISDPVFVDDNAEKNEDGVGLVEPNNWPSFSASQKTWSSLLKDSTRSDDRKGIEDIATLTQELNLSCTDQSNMEWDSYCFGPCSDEKRMCLEAAGEDSGKVYEQEGLRINNEIQHSSIMSEGTISFAKSTPYGVVTADDLKQDSKESRMATSEMNPYLTAERNSSCFVPDLVTESHPIDALVYEDGAEITEEEHVHFKSSGECTSSSAIIKENISKNSYCNDSVVDGMISDAIYSPEATLALETESSGGVQSIVARLVEEVRELKSSHLKQSKKICSLKIDLVESKFQIQALRDRLNLLEFGSRDEQEELEPTTVKNLDESILIIGGFDGSMWLSALDCYHPSRDVLESLCPMNLVRSYASAAKLNGEIYVFGGVYGNLWYDRVESYNPVKNQWTIRPSLSQRKGNMAGISYNDKIFAIGGGNGVESLSEVEMFDLDVGRWIPSRSMLQKRFAPAAAEINGAIYVAGGFDGQDYLKSVERFDPREYSWRRLESMSTMRGCHSLAVLNEKLYAMGGFDGDKMVSTIEVFDPRKNSWMMEESMKESRGYSSAVVIGDAIYIIGGLNDEGQVLDTVECYKEGLGCNMIDSKAIGKRAFFSAFVLGA